MWASTTCFATPTRRAMAWPICPAPMTTMTLLLAIPLRCDFRSEHRVPIVAHALRLAL